MCPVCITTIALWVAGATSAGGLGLIAAKTLRAKPGAKTSPPKPQPTENQSC